MKCFKHVTLICLYAIGSLNAMDRRHAEAGPSAPAMAAAQAPRTYAVFGTINTSAHATATYSANNQTIIIQDNQPTSATVIRVAPNDVWSPRTFERCAMSFSRTGRFIVCLRQTPSGRTITDILNARTLMCAYRRDDNFTTQWSCDDSVCALDHIGQYRYIVHFGPNDEFSTYQKFRAQFVGFSRDGRKTYLRETSGAQRCLAIDNQTEEATTLCCNVRSTTISPDGSRLVVVCEALTCLYDTTDDHVIAQMKAKGGLSATFNSTARAFLVQRSPFFSDHHYATLHASDDGHQIGEEIAACCISNGFGGCVVYWPQFVNDGNAIGVHGRYYSALTGLPISAPAQAAGQNGVSAAFQARQPFDGQPIAFASDGSGLVTQQEIPGEGMRLTIYRAIASVADTAPQAVSAAPAQPPVASPEQDIIDLTQEDEPTANVPSYAQASDAASEVAPTPAPASAVAPQVHNSNISSPHQESPCIVVPCSDSSDDEPLAEPMIDLNADLDAQEAAQNAREAAASAQTKKVHFADDVGKPLATTVENKPENCGDYDCPAPSPQSESPAACAAAQEPAPAPAAIAPSMQSVPAVATQSEAAPTPVNRVRPRETSSSFDSDGQEKLPLKKRLNMRSFSN